MADTGQVTLGAVRAQAQQKADMVGSTFLTTVEWNQMISLSYKSLYDLLITTYGDDYFVAQPYSFVTTSAQLYALPDGVTTTDASTGLVAQALYKLLGVEVQSSSSQNAWITLRRFEFQERNRYNLGNTYNVLGRTNLRYKIEGSNLWLASPPATGQTIRIWYIPKPVNLQPAVTIGTTSSSTTVTCTDTTQLSVGMTVSDYLLAPGATAVIPSGTTISSITPNTSFVLSQAATATNGSLLVGCWSDQTTFDGVSGWEEYVTLDAAVKAMAKEESDPSVLIAQRNDLEKRIIDTAPNRDAAEAPTVTDAAALDGFFDYPGYGPWGDQW